jgi:hemolysin activation/secretion protein
MKPLFSFLSVLTSALLCATQAWAQGPTFSIERFQVDGNSLLSAEQIATLVTPYQGTHKSFADIQLAQEALEKAYRSLGFSAVVVALPEQDITAGVVRFTVVEARLDTISVKGNHHFSQDNVLRSLPALRSGDMPNAIEMTENLSLANENPAKRTEITLKISDKPGFVNAEAEVKEDVPRRFTWSLDNTGRGTTAGDWRVGLAWQHANLFDRDQVLSLQYTTSPTHAEDVTLLNLGYRIPLYDMGDSLDLYAGGSNVDAGTFGATSGIDGFVGKGKIAGLRYNQNLTRLGEYDHNIKYGLDWKLFENACTGSACGFVGADVVTTPVSISYQGNWNRPNAQSSVAVTHLRNTRWGHLNDAANYAGATHQPGTVGTERDFALWRLNVSHLQGLAGGWQGRINLNAQFTKDPLVAGEQLGLAGTLGVRGFNEREVARDQGAVWNMELYSPNLAPKLKFNINDLRGLFFIDMAHGRFVRNAAEPDALKTNISSLGVGLRLLHQKSLSAKFDLARVVQGAGQQRSGDWSGHIALSFAH